MTWQWHAERTLIYILLTLTIKKKSLSQTVILTQTVN